MPYYSHNFNQLEDNMGFKKIDRTFTFADAILKDSMDKNRCLIRIMEIAESIDWNSIEAVLM